MTSRGDYGDAMLSLAIDATLRDMASEALYAPAAQRAHLTRLQAQLTSSRDSYETTGAQREVAEAYLVTSLEYLELVWTERAMPGPILTANRQRIYRRLEGLRT